MKERSHRARRRLRAARHPGRAAQTRQDGQVRQEIARLRELHAQTGDNALLKDVEIWKKILDRSQPMPTLQVVAKA